MFAWPLSLKQCYHLLSWVAAQPLASGNAVFGPLHFVPLWHSLFPLTLSGSLMSLGCLSVFTCLVHRTRLAKGAAPTPNGCSLVPPPTVSIFLHSRSLPLFHYYGIFPVWPQRALLCFSVFFFVFGLESETLVLFLILILAFARETTTATRWRRTRRAQRGSVLNWRRANASGSGRISYSHRDIKMSSAMSRASSLTYVPGSRWMWPYPWS